MYRSIFLVVGHLIFWAVSFYVITRIFGISTVEIIEENTNGIEEKVLITYDHKFTLASSITIALCALMFYTNIFVFLKSYFIEKNLGKYIVQILILLLVLISINILLNRYVSYSVVERKEVFLFPSFGLHMALFIFYAAISFAYAFTLEWYKNEKLRSQIAAEKVTTELNYLKAQINPHFLFNTLNNLFSISQKYKVDELSRGINELSNLMRYMLYESNADFVALKKEVKYIEDFIQIQQLRHDEEDELIINFEKKGDFEKAVIAPMILLPFVENAFKHGFSLNESSVINLSLETSESGFFFKVKNKAFQHHKFTDKTSGIGLENVTRRLNLIYPKKHSLSMFRDNDNFIVELTIQPHA
ncbi:MAG: histidine kinase [Pricia sp.]|nr:histidine kinase [Pricia sp.]